MVLDRVDRAVFASNREVGVHFSNFFSDQPELQRLRSIFFGLLVPKGHGAQLHQCIAFIRHVAYIFLETDGRGLNPELTAGVYDDHGSGDSGAENTCNECRGLSALGSDQDGVVVAVRAEIADLE
jgi:hypothetical protein